MRTLLIFVLLTSTAASARAEDLWKQQLMPGDASLEGRYSRTAAEYSNAVIFGDVAFSTALVLGQQIDRSAGKRGLVYGEAIAAALVINTAVKYLVSRPRPYLYSNDPNVQAMAEIERDDSRLSFYSAHATVAFSSAVSGSMLFARRTSDSNARAAVWGVSLAAAAATADLRTRAGMHFYSDVLVGALVGVGLGVLSPAVQGQATWPTGREWISISLAPLIGVLIAELTPLGKETP